MINSFFLVGVGGALGSMLRYGMAIVIGARSFPFSTFTVNLLGCLLIGILYGLGLRHNVSNYTWKFFGIGICGGFTTFSAFSLEGLEFLQQGRMILFLVYVLLSVGLGLIFTYLGYIITK